MGATGAGADRTGGRCDRRGVHRRAHALGAARVRARGRRAVLAGDRHRALHARDAGAQGHAGLRAQAGSVSVLVFDRAAVRVPAGHDWWVACRALARGACFGQGGCASAALPGLPGAASDGCGGVAGGFRCSRALGVAFGAGDCRGAGVFVGAGARRGVAGGARVSSPADSPISACPRRLLGALPRRLFASAGVGLSGRRQIGRGVISPLATTCGYWRAFCPESRFQECSHAFFLAPVLLGFRAVCRGVLCVVCRPACPVGVCRSAWGSVCSRLALHRLAGLCRQLFSGFLAVG